MQVKELMKQPYVIDRDMNLSEAASIMGRKNIGSLILVIKNRAKGIITEGDLLDHFGEKSKISSIMSKKIISIGPEEAVDEALRIMKKNKIKRLPVIDKKKNLIGIITLSDIAKRIDDLEGEFFF